MYELDNGYQDLDLRSMSEIPLSTPNPEKDAELTKSAVYNLDTQVILWENGKPVGGTVWVDATPHVRNIPVGTPRDSRYFAHKYKTSFSYNLNYATLLKNIIECAKTKGVSKWNYLDINGTNQIVSGRFAITDRFTVDKNCWEYYFAAHLNSIRTPNFDLSSLNYNIPVFLVQGMHIMNPGIAPKPVLDGVLVCRNAQAKPVKASMSTIEKSFYDQFTYSTYENNCFASFMPYYNMLPDHSFGEGDIVAYHGMCLKLDLALKYLQENRLPFPFIIQLANSERILHYNKEEISEILKRCIYTYSNDKSEAKLEKTYKSCAKIYGLDTSKQRSSLFKPTKAKINSLTYGYRQGGWEFEIPSQAEAQYLYNQICIFNRGVIG